MFLESHCTSQALHLAPNQPKWLKHKKRPQSKKMVVWLKQQKFLKEQKFCRLSGFQVYMEHLGLI